MVEATRRRIIHNLGVKPGNTQFNAELPKDLHRQIVAMARKKGLTVAEYAERVFRATLESEGTESPKFLEAWEKFLSDFRKRAKPE